MKKQRLLLLVLLVVAVCLYAGGKAEETSEMKVVKIGTLGPLTGPGAMWGLQQRQAAVIWAETVNDRGGLLVAGERYHIEVPGYDDKFDNAVARTACEKAILDGVKFLIGPNNEVQNAAIRDICHAAKVINIGIYWDPKGTGPDTPFSWCGMMQLPQATPLLLDLILEKYDVKRIGYCFWDIPASRIVQDDIAQVARDKGLVVTDETFFAPGQVTDFYPYASRMIKGNPDVLDMRGGPQEVGLFAKSLRELGYKGLIISEHELDPNEIISVGKEDADGIITQMWMYDPATATPELRDFHDRYVKAYGTWDSAIATKLLHPFFLAAAIQKAGSTTDTEAIVREMQTLQLKSPYQEGSPLIRATGMEYYGANNQIAVPFPIGQIQDGKPVALDVFYLPAEAGVTYEPPYEFQW